MSGFWQELRRRKVARTAIAYAIGAWAVWQVVDVVTPALGWPERVLTFVVVGAIALAPVVLALSWLLELRPERLDAEPTPSLEAPDPEPQAQHLGRNAMVVSLPALSLSALLAFLLWPTTGAAVPDFEPGDPTLISECENATSDPDLGRVLNTALDAVLRQSRYVEITSTDAARSFAVRYLQREPPVTVDVALANEIAIRGGYKVAIHCAIRPIGEGYQISARLTEPRGPTDLAVLTRQAREDRELFTAIDAMASDLRAALGESLSSIEADRPLAVVTTPSLEALRNYTLALDAEDRGDLEQAQRLMLAALERDSLFARAHSALGNWAYWQGDRPTGERHFRAALQDPQRLAERDRLWIEATWAGSRDDHDQAVTLYTAYLDRWPGDASGWYNLGSQFFRAQRCDDAGDAFARVLALDSANAPARINLASCLATVGRRDSALAQYQVAFDLQPTWLQIPNLNHEYGFVLVGEGRAEEARMLFERQLEGSVEQQAFARRSLALLNLYQGRYRAALPLLQEAVRQRQTLNQGLSELRDRLYLSGVYSALGQPEAVAAQLQRIGALSTRFYTDPSWLAYAAEYHQRLGHRDEVAAILARVEADTLATGAATQGAVVLVRAILQLADGDTAGAFEQARRAADVFPGSRTRIWTCRLALLRGDTNTAREECAQLGRENALGWEAQEPYLLSRFWLGRIEEDQASPDAALSHYRALAEVWSDADEGLTFADVDGAPVDVLSHLRTVLGRGEVPIA